LKYPRSPAQREGTPMDTKNSTAPHPAPHPAPSTEEPCFACYGGTVYIGHLIEDECGEEVEVIEAVPCRRCSVSDNA